ncbi:hypothetical protein L0F63_002122 [Massospora cicadina]|nr:hypothetical protein L0F63_002122 [Massospora cicadina]
MQSNNPYGEGPLSLAEMNRSFKEALEGWLSSCRKETADPYPRLPSGWNAAEPYCFEYMHPLSQYHFQFKSITAGNRLFTHATALETRETYSFDVVSEEYVCNHALFPLRVGSAGPPAELDLGRLFSGRGTFKNYLTEFQLQIVQKLVPGLQKESCLETPLEEETRASFSQPRSPPGPRDNSGPAGADAAPSNFQQGRHPLAYGDRDLDPLGGVGPGLPRFGVGSGAMDPARMIGAIPIRIPSQGMAPTFLLELHRLVRDLTRLPHLTQASGTLEVVCVVSILVLPLVGNQTTTRLRLR